MGLHAPRKLFSRLPKTFRRVALRHIAPLEVPSTHSKEVGACSMHELSLCNSIFRIVDRAAEGRPVSVVNLQVGQLRQVVPDTLVFCWSMVSEATPLSGSRLNIDSVPGRLMCGSCGSETTVVEA